MSIYSSGSSPLRGRYLVRNPVINTGLAMWDGILRLTRAPAPVASASSPRRIVIGIGCTTRERAVLVESLKHLDAPGG